MEKEKPNMKYRPSAEYRYWLYDPDGDGMVYFRTQAERDQRAESVIDAYLDDGWADEVELVAAGELTHFAQLIDKEMRPPDEALDDEQRDGGGIEWPEGMTWRGNYVMAPLVTPNAQAQASGAGAVEETTGGCTASPADFPPSLLNDGFGVLPAPTFERNFDG